MPRLRHGYLTLGWEHDTLLIGQTWDLISPLFPTVNADTLMWNAGNLGDRRPQIRYTHAAKQDQGQWVLQGALAATGAIDGQDLDADGVRDGDDAVLPNVQVRIGYSGKTGSGNGKWGLGLSGHYGRQELRTPVAGEDRFESTSLSLDFMAELTPRLSLQGELWTGSNLGDFRGGIGQNLDTATGEEIDSSGGWVELGFKASDLYSFYLGTTQDDPDDDFLGNGRPIKNGASYLVNRFRLAPAFTIGLDYLRWKTEYKSFEEGVDNRLNLYFIYNL
ncbi:MAG: hypothetical protein HC897_10115 [Thermoanaerobaculia bacterium]|nr:hypothetical protein [Thermoanaerobaculia bacterium]